MEEKLSSLKQSGDDPGAERPDDTGRTLCETDFDSIISSTFDLPEHDWSQYSPLTLAWLGDTVFDLLVRTQIVKNANMSPDRLHRKATAVVNARNQARIAEEISPLLTEEEAAVMRRGRNSSPGHSAKNAERREYGFKKAKEEGITVLESPLTAYEICARLAAKGLPGKHE